MKPSRVVLALSTVLLAACVAPGPERVPAEPAADFVVATDGNDANPGTAAKPFASIARAQAAVRQHPAFATGDVVVLVRGGTYALAAPLVFTPADSASEGHRVTYAAWPGEQPVFTGGVRIDGFTAGPDGLWRAQIPPTLAGGFEHLFVNGQRALRARWPDAGAFLLTRVDEDPKPQGRTRAGKSTVTLGFPSNALAPFADLPRAALSQVQLVVHHKWDHTRRTLDAVDLQAGTVTTHGQQMKPWNPMAKGCLAYFENVPASCNAPGEWFIEAGGVLAYRPRPGEQPEKTAAFAPRTSLLVAFAGDPASGRTVANITLEGLAFAHADSRTPAAGFEPNQASTSVGAAVQAEGAHRVTLRNCAVSQTGAHGIWLRRGCEGCRIEHCRIEDLGGGAVYLGDTKPPSRPGDSTSGNVVDNNILQRGGRYYPSATAVWIGHSASNAVTHNDIGDFFYTGISVGWVWGYAPSVAKGNDIGFNHVHDLGQGWLSDMGGIYTLGRSEGTRVHDNWFHHIWSHTYGGWGLYTDEGSTGITFENNLVHDTKDGSFHQHYGATNLVRNNLLAFSRPFQVAASRVEDHRSFTFEHNIVVWDEGTVFKGNWEKVDSVTRSNLWWSYAAGSTNAAVTTLARWQAAGRETGSRAVDPGFVNAAARDFRLRDPTAARSIGFTPFAQRAGVHGEASWIEAARAAPMPEFSHLPDWAR